MNPQLNENDPALDRLLAGLASATPDAGFAQRVLHGVESRRVAAGPARYRRSAWTWGLASAAGFAVICTVVVLSYPRYGLTGQRRRDVANQSMRMPQAEPATLRVETLDQPGRRALRRIAGRPSKPVFDDQRSERVSFPAYGRSGRVRDVESRGSSWNRSSKRRGIRRVFQASPTAETDSEG